MSKQLVSEASLSQPFVEGDFSLLNKAERKQIKKHLKQLHKLQKKSAKQLKKLNKLKRKASHTLDLVVSAEQQVNSLSKKISSQVNTSSQLAEFNSPKRTISSAIDDLNIDTDIGISDQPKKHKKLSKVNKLTPSWSHQSSSAIEFARTPLKASPCKKCPAKAGGFCKCAISKMKM